MKKYTKILLSFVSLLIFANNVYATTIKETTTTNDNYDTIERNTTIIGATKFTSTEVITASKATTAGANDATLYMKKNGTIEGYKTPTIYIYYGPVGGWYSLDENNKATYIEDKDLLAKLSSLDIYYVNNKEKVIGVEYTGNEIDTAKLPKGVGYSNNMLQVNSTLSNFEIYTTDNDKISYSFNDTLNTFEIDNSSCYTINEGYITDYDSTCSKNVVIPSKIKNEKIIGIKEYAFYNKGLTSVVIPETVMNLENSAFAGNQLTSVTVNEKYELNNFDYYGQNIFGTFTDITYNNILTRAAKLIPDTITVKISDKMNIKYSSPTGNASYECYKSDSLECYSFDMANLEIQTLLIENGYDNIDAYGYGIEIDKLGVYIDIYDDNLESRYYIEKTVNLNTEIVKTDINQYDEMIEDIIKTNDKYLENTEEEKYTNVNNINLVANKYDADIHYGPHFFGGYKKYQDTNIYTSFRSLSLLITKDNVLYGMITEMYKAEERFYLSNNYYNPSDISIENHIKVVLKEFEETTNITNYKIIKTTNGKDYIENFNEDYMYTGPQGDYAIEIVDLDNEMTWLVIFNKNIKNNYDENGFTKLECFTIEDRTITGYDKTCGKDIVIPNQDSSGNNITKIDGWVFGYNTVKSVKLPDYLEELGHGVFYDNPELTEVILPETLKKINDTAFYNTSIKEIILPDSITYIGCSAFQNTSISNIVIPESVTEIASYAFSNTKLKEVRIPNTVLTIGDDAFDEDVKINFEDEMTEVAYNIPNYTPLYIQKDLNLNKSLTVEIEPENGIYHSNYLVSYTNAYLEQLIDDAANKDYITWNCPNSQCDYYIEYELSSSNSEESNSIVYNVKIYNDTKTINKQVEFYIHNTIGNPKDAETVNNFINNELKDEYIYKYINYLNNYELVTSEKKLKNFVSNNHVNIIFPVYGSGGGGPNWNEDDADYCLVNSMHNGYSYFIKDDILYGVTSLMIAITEPLMYYPVISPKDYTSVDEYVDDVLNKFSEFTEITEYDINLVDGEKYKINKHFVNSSGEIVSELPETEYYYSISLVDKLSNRDWLIKFKYSEFK